MYQLLIVDDEIYAVQAIQSGIDWEKLAINEVNVAYNVRQAKEILTQQPIDIMICDIEMPQGNGIELLSWVREHHSTTECIFLTCHSDFNYAKKALQLGSLDYILKPVRFNELERTIQKAVAKVAEKRKQLTRLETGKHYLDLWSLNQPVLVERFWLDLLDQTIPSNPKQIREILIKNNFPFQESESFLPILVSVQHWFKKLTLREEKIMEFALYNAAEYMILNRYKHSQLVRLRNDAFLILLPACAMDKFDKVQLRQNFEEYIAACHRFFYCDLSCYIGKQGYVSEIVTVFDSLLEMEKNNVNQNNQVFFLSKPNKNFVHMDIKLFNMWLEMMKKGAMEDVFVETGQYLDSWKSANGLEANMLQEFCQSFLHMLYRFFQYKGLQAYEVLDEEISLERMSMAVRSVSDLQVWVNNVLQKTIDYCRLAADTQTVMDKIKKFISQNLSQSMTREDIANYVHLHPDYLSRMFKKETGKSVVEYISEEKINLAKELLVKSGLSVSEIAVTVGYSNFSYFSKIFKKCTHMNPHEFRKSNRVSHGTP